MTRWLIAAVLVAPLGINPFGASTGVMQAKNALLIHLGMGCVIWMLSSRWLQAILAVAWLSWLVNGMHGFLFIGLLGLVCWALLFEQATRLTDPQWRNIRAAIVIAACLQLAWMLIQATGHDPIFLGIASPGQGAEHVDSALRVPIEGWFSNTSDAALFLGLSLPAAVAWHPALGLVVAAGVLAMRSTAGLVCVGLVALWWCARRGWRAFGAGMAVVVIGAGLFWWFLDPQGVGWRPTIWRAGFGVFLAKPITGWGLNAVDYSILVDSPVGRWQFLQNEWLQLGVETGVMGLGVVVAYAWSLLWRMASAWERLGELVPAVLMLLVVSLFSIPFRIGPVALLGALYLGRTERLLRS